MSHPGEMVPFGGGGGQYQHGVIGMDGRILKRGHDLKTVLRVLEKKLIRSVD